MLNIHWHKKQHGSTLLVGMIMLILLTLLAVSAIQSTTSNLQVVGNAQFREEATAAAQQAIENVISSPAFTTAVPAEQNIDINRDGVTDYSVVFSPAPTCNTYKVLDPNVDPVIPDDCIGMSNLCYRTTWDISALVSDVNTGTKVQLHQGVKLIVGLNAALASCGVT